jgi:hypothetical protein
MRRIEMSVLIDTPRESAWGATRCSSPLVLVVAVKPTARQVLERRRLV